MVRMAAGVARALRGLGSLIVSSSQTRGPASAPRAVLMVGFAVVVANPLTDLLYGWIDPRIRYE